MTFADGEAIADAILYEGYMLYPYRRSALKNRAGWTFGVISPRDATRTSASALRCECLVLGGSETEVSAKLRFLLPLSLSDGERALPCEVVAQPVRIEDPAGSGMVLPFAFAHAGEGVEGQLEIALSCVAENVYRLTVAVSNLTSPAVSAERWQSGSMVSTHVLLSLRGGEFVPPREPPSWLPAAQPPDRLGLWPILVGRPGRRDSLLCSPIILEDYPQIASESPGSLFDGTEIDEILTLRILTLAPEERDEIARGDPRVRELISRTEALAPAQLAQLHGTRRVPRDGRAEGRPTLRVGDRDLGAGDHVRLRPTRRADIMDIALVGRLATIVSVEQDYDGRSYFAVTVDEDPGQDLGALGKPGHRFFFGADEVELVPA